MTTTIIGLTLDGVCMEGVDPEEAFHSAWRVKFKDEPLGEIEWNSNDQQYVFCPRSERRLTPQVLRALTKLVDIVNKEHREKWWETGIAGIPTS